MSDHSEHFTPVPLRGAAAPGDDRRCDARSRAGPGGLEAERRRMMRRSRQPSRPPAAAGSPRLRRACAQLGAARRRHRRASSPRASSTTPALDELEELLIARRSRGRPSAATLVAALRRRPLRQGGRRRGGPRGARRGHRAHARAGRAAACPSTRRRSRMSCWSSASTAAARRRPSASSPRIFRDEGRTVMLAAGDTFRAAAIEQLADLGRARRRPVVSGAQGADAAGLAYDALEKARAAGADVLLIDTAGRLHNKAELMAELQKIVARAEKARCRGAARRAARARRDHRAERASPRSRSFARSVGVTGLVVTKLDGTARGGVARGACRANSDSRSMPSASASRPRICARSRPRLSPAPWSAAKHRQNRPKPRNDHFRRGATRSRWRQ